MSFSSEQKSFLVKQNIKSQCCRRAMLEGMLVSRATLDEGRIRLSLGNDEIANYAATIISELYSKECAFIRPKEGGRRRMIVFDSHAAYRYTLSVSNGDIFFTEKCSDCLGAFLRGVFLASGRVSDPEKLYLLEFSPGNNTDKLVKFLSNNGLNPRISEKPSETVVYFRDSNEIEMFFAIAGMNQTAFTIMNTKIKREMINNVQRIANCETNNIGKAVSASMMHIAVIDELIKRGMLSYLPDELQLTAKARIEHRDLSLSQLASIMTPPISKPGLSHRLKKITELAKELLEK